MSISMETLHPLKSFNYFVSHPLSNDTHVDPANLFASRESMLV